MGHEHIEQVKHIADATTGVSLAVTWIATLTPVMNFVIIVLAIVWAVYRIHDMRLSIKIKKHTINRQHNERSTD